MINKQLLVNTLSHSKHFYDKREVNISKKLEFKTHLCLVQLKPQKQRLYSGGVEDKSNAIVGVDFLMTANYKSHLVYLIVLLVLYENIPFPTTLA